MQSLYTAATGMEAQQSSIDTIANNLANSSTTGFKAQRVDFQDLLYLNLKPAGTPTSGVTKTPNGIQIGEGVKLVATDRIFTQGPVQNTNNPLDLMITVNNGFFKVTLPNGDTAYTRDGTFQQDGDGNIVTNNGYFLDPQVQIPQDTTAITINTAGQILVTQAGSTNQTQIGQLEISNFVNPNGLQSIGSNLYVSTPASGEAIDGTPGSQGFGNVTQGSLEASNVDVVTEMVNLITAQRAYEDNAKVVSTCDDNLSVVAQLKQLP